VVEETLSMPVGRPAALYEEHVGRAVGLAALLTGDRYLAEDIGHDAFLKVAGRFGELRDPRAFGAYLRRTVVNMCRARTRRLGRERKALEQEVRNEAVDPDRTSEDRDELWPAIQGLPYRQRVAVVLRYWDDLPEAQIAETMRCSPRAVNALLSRAMATLRSQVGREPE
jgi:RNA polymerase sigma factor (sigma-70 family)